MVLSRALNFDDFVNILKIYLDDSFDFGNQLSMRDFEDAVLELNAIFRDFTLDKQDKDRVPIEEFSDLTLFFIKKASTRKFVRFTRIKSFDFFDLLEQALLNETVQFRQYMLYLKKNLGYVIVEDLLKILRRFKVISLPGGSDLQLNPTASRFGISTTRS